MNSVHHHAAKIIRIPKYMQGLGACMNEMLNVVFSSTNGGIHRV